MPETIHASEWHSHNGDSEILAFGMASFGLAELKLKYGEMKLIQNPLDNSFFH